MTAQIWLSSVVGGASVAAIAILVVLVMALAITPLAVFFSRGWEHVNVKHVLKLPENNLLGLSGMHHRIITVEYPEKYVPAHECYNTKFMDEGYQHMLYVDGSNLTIKPFEVSKDNGIHVHIYPDENVK